MTVLTVDCFNSWLFWKLTVLTADCFENWLFWKLTVLKTDCFNYRIWKLTVLIVAQFWQLTVLTVHWKRMSFGRIFNNFCSLFQWRHYLKGIVKIMSIHCSKNVYNIRLTFLHWKMKIKSISIIFSFQKFIP